MYWIVNWSVNFRRVVIPVAAGLLIFGIVQLGNAKQDLLPEFGPTTVEVQTEALGLSASEVEQLITVPLEQDLLNGVAFLDSIESVSLPGLSSVVMTFEPGTDVLDARQVVAERLTQAAGLPQVADPPQMLQPLSSTSRVAVVSLSSDELTPIDMSVLAHWVMVPRLLGVEGVANVSIWGFKDQQLQVLVDPARLAASNVTLAEVIRTSGNALEVSPLTFLEASLPGTGGFVDTTNQRLHVFHEQVISTPEELAQVTVEDSEGGAVFVAGNPVALGDVADIITDHQPLIGDAVCTGGPCLLLVIEKFPEVSTPEVAAGIDEALDALQLGLPGMEIDASIYRPAELIDESIVNLRTALLVGLVLLVVLVAVFFLNWRIVLVGSVSIVSSLVVAALVLYLFGTTFNAMIIAGLVAALVMIVDDAIIGARGAAGAAGPEDADGGHATSAIVDAVLRLRSTAAYSAVIVAAVMLPVIALEGVAGAFLEPIAVAYLVAIISAFLVSLTVAPALSVLLLSGDHSGDRSSPAEAAVQSWYRGFAAKFISKTGAAAAVAGGLVVAGLVAIVLLSPSFAPGLQDRDIVVGLEAAAGTSLDQMDTIAADMLDEIAAKPGVETAGAHVGRAIMSDKVVNVNSAEIWVSLAEGSDYQATTDSIEAIVDNYDQVAGRVSTYADIRVRDVLDNGGEDVVVRVYGEDPDTRLAMAEQVRDVVTTINGAGEPTIDLSIEEPVVEIEVDLDMARAFAVKPGDVRRQAATLVSGIVVGNLFEDQKVFDVVVWGVPEIRDTVENIRALPIATPSGDHVPLGELADVRVIDRPAAITHESVATYIDVLIPTAGGSLDDIAAEADVLVAGINFPLEHHAEVLTDYEAARAARSRLLAISVAALILVYLLLQAAFVSWRLATLAFVVLPAGVAGSFVAAALAGGEFTLGAAAGTLAVFGFAVHGVLLVIRGCQHRERLGESFGEDLILGETERLAAPLAASAVGIAVLFTPLALYGSRVGLEAAGSMAIAVLGGLVTSVVLVLVVVPTLYLRWGYVADKDRSADDLFAHDEPVTTVPGGDA